MAKNDVIVLLEFQNQWTKPGLFNLLVGREMRRNNVLKNAQTLLGVARKVGVPVLQAPLWVDPKNLKGLYAHLTRGMFFRKGSIKGAIDERIMVDTDIVIQGRTAFDAFVGSDLEETLKPYRGQRILFAGFATDQCVLKTILSAQKLGYDAWLISDVSATFFKFIQNNTENKLGDKVINTASLVKEYTP